MTETNTILDFFYSWFYKILNTENSYNIPIIFGEQNAPAPEEPYMVIHQPFAITKIGSGNKEMSTTTGQEGTMLYDIHYQGTMQVEEVGGTGDKLRLVINSLIRQDILDLFSTNKISVLRVENITPSNTNDENIWTLRTITDLIILFADEGSYEANYIETVGTISGTYSETQN
jgi:hypothetical protein